MKGIIGKFFFQFGVTISVAVLISLLEALTLAPMRCSRLLEVGERASRLERWVEHRLRAPRRRLPARCWCRRCTTAGSCWPGRPSSSSLSLGHRQAAAAGVRPLAGHEPLRDPLPDPGRLEPRHHRPRPRARSSASCSRGPRSTCYGGFVGGFGGGEVNSGFVFVTHEGPGDRPRRPEDRAGGSRSRSSWTSRGRRRARIPGARDRAAGLLAARLQRRPRRRLPGRVQHPRPRLGRARPRLARDHGEDARVGAGDRRRQRLPGRHARGAGGPRPQQGGRPRDLAWPTIGETINSAIGGQRVGKFKDKGRRFDIRVRLLAPQRQRPEDIERLLVRTGGGGLVRLGDIVRIEQRPTLQAITRRDRERAITHLRQRRPRRLAGRRHRRARCRSRARSCPTATARVPSGTRAAFRESFDSLLLRLRARPDRRLHGAGRRSSTPSPTRSRCCWPCPSASAARSSRSGSGRPEHQRLQHARHHPAHGDRQEELDPARGLHEPDPRARAWSATRRCCRPARSACGRS